MEILEHFDADEIAILEKINNKPYEYLSGNIPMTPIEQGVLERYMFLSWTSYLFSLAEEGDADEDNE